MKAAVWEKFLVIRVSYCLLGKDKYFGWYDRLKNWL